MIKSSTPLTNDFLLYLYNELPILEKIEWDADVQENIELMDELTTQEHVMHELDNASVSASSACLDRIRSYSASTASGKGSLV